MAGLSHLFVPDAGLSNRRGHRAPSTTFTLTARRSWPANRRRPRPQTTRTELPDHHHRRAGPRRLSDSNDSSFEGKRTGSVGTSTAGASSAVAASETEAEDGTWSLRFTFLRLRNRPGIISQVPGSCRDGIHPYRVSRAGEPLGPLHSRRPRKRRDLIVNEHAPDRERFSGASTALSELPLRLRRRRSRRNPQHRFRRIFIRIPLPRPSRVLSFRATAWVVGGWAGPPTALLPSTMIPRSDGLQVRTPVWRIRWQPPGWAAGHDRRLEAASVLPIPVRLSCRTRVPR